MKGPGHYNGTSFKDECLMICSEGNRTDPGAVGVVEACLPTLERHAKALLHSGEEADALVRDCLAVGLDRLHTGLQPTNIKLWLLAIMHRLLATKYQRPNVRDESETYEGIAEDSMCVSDIFHVLDRLPMDQKGVLLLVIGEDLRYAEVAEVLGISLGTVMSRLSLGREQLRRFMRGETASASDRRK